MKIRLDETSRIAGWCVIGGMENAIEVDALPEGDPHDYLYVDGSYVYSPAPPFEDLPPEPSLESRMDAVQEHNEQQDLTIDDMVLLMAEMIGGE